MYFTIGKWINKWRYIHTTEYYSATKKEKLTTHLINMDELQNYYAK